MYPSSISRRWKLLVLECGQRGLKPEPYVMFKVSAFVRVWEVCECVCGSRGFLDAHSPPGVLCHACKWRRFIPCGFQKHQQNTQQRHSEKAQADPPCMLMSVTLTCFCGFYRQLHTTMSRITTLKAPEHWPIVQPQCYVGRTQSLPLSLHLCLHISTTENNCFCPKPVFHTLYCSSYILMGKFAFHLWFCWHIFYWIIVFNHVK